MKKNTEAKISGHTLTAGFHSANPPLIWRFDLERNHSFTLSLQGEEGDYELGITSPRGDFYPVVHFADREDAEEALLKVEATLAKRRGGAGSLVMKALGVVAALAAIIIVAVVGFGLYVQHQASAPSAQLSSEIAPQGAPTPMPDGIPVSADDVLKAPSR
jgi:hypothetical protein